MPRFDDVEVGRASFSRAGVTSRYKGRHGHYYPSMNIFGAQNDISGGRATYGRARAPAAELPRIATPDRMQSYQPPSIG